MNILRRIFYSGVHYQLRRYPDSGFAVAYAAVHLALPIFFMLLAILITAGAFFEEIDAVLRALNFPLMAGFVFLGVHQLSAWTYGSERQLREYYTLFEQDERLVSQATMFAFGPAIVAVMLLVVSLVLF